MNSRPGESVSDFYRAKIKLGEFKAVYSSLKYINCIGHMLEPNHARGVKSLGRAVDMMVPCLCLDGYMYVRKPYVYGQAAR